MSFLVWLVLGYVIPWSAVLGRSERPVVALANGTWFIWVVASQSVAVSAATLEVVFVDAKHYLAILAVFSWSVGVFLYAASAIIVSLRIMLYDLDPKDFDPPYWVSMGAVAITVVAGARIVEMDAAPMVDATRGLIAGLSVVFWAFATWLIPVLVAAGVAALRAQRAARVRADAVEHDLPARHVRRGRDLPGARRPAPIVEAIGSNWLWVAVTWVIVFVAMVRSVSRALVTRPR